MQWKKAQAQWVKIVQYIPITWNALLIGITAYIIGKWLYHKPVKGEAPSAMFPFVVLLLKIAAFSLIVLIVLSILSALVCWLHYLWLSKKQEQLLDVQFRAENEGRWGNVHLEATLPGVWKPFLGFVTGKLVYDDNRLTDSFSLLSTRKRNRKWQIAGKSHLQLHDVKEYELKGGYVYFQDMFHLCSFALKQPIKGYFHRIPSAVSVAIDEIYPKKTESQDIRIEQLRRVNGDLLNYKRFESGDDVRRIVWKLYAKNKELVVRVPELFEPYASHLHYYASFYTSLPERYDHSPYMIEMLNRYKNTVWAIYENLSKKELKVGYIPETPFMVTDTDLHPVMQNISASEWQHNISLEEYYNPKTGAVLCISSLCPPKHLKPILEKCDAQTVVFFVKLSTTFTSNVPMRLMARLFISPPQDKLNRLKTTWLFTPIRLQLKQQEEEIVKVLRNSLVKWVEL
ncbi:MAG: DUF58 domain-containing protein [Chitinophagia bacterium]|nr:DUF58 domain-containing protein [Chitinophagia bacterium]